MQKTLKAWMWFLPCTIHSNQNLIVIDTFIKSSLLIASICFWSKDWQFGTVHHDYWIYLFINQLSNGLVCQWLIKSGHYYRLEDVRQNYFCFLKTIQWDISLNIRWNLCSYFIFLLKTILKVTSDKFLPEILWRDCLKYCAHHESTMMEKEDLSN